MNMLRRYSAQTGKVLLAVPLIALFSAGTGYAFTDTNDSASQAEVVKNLQKRVDSLELRFEKQEVARNEAKKTALDWNRGVFAGGHLGISSPINYFTGYMFNIKRSDGSHFSLSSMLRIGSCEYFNLDSNGGPGTLKLAIGLQRGIPLVDKVSFSWGTYLHSVLDNEDSHYRADALGGGADMALNFWFTERGTLGLGAGLNMYFTKPDAVSWLQSVQNSDYDFGAAIDFHIAYTQYFFKHDGRSRK